MRIDTTASEISKATIRQGAEFFVALSSGMATEADIAACKSWRVASPHHELVWQQLQSVDSLFGNLSAPEKRALAIHYARRDKFWRNVGVTITMILVAITGLLLLPAFV